MDDDPDNHPAADVTTSVPGIGTVRCLASRPDGATRAARRLRKGEGQPGSP
ncbi:hypothetical protein ACFVGY_24930 [Streptomyces sp. NPDC127106]|uniref:hypothetical protein n=1 Tax=Streptomyces sp. NPDC127106 TaxID=3345360 RepID=UPI003627E743